MREGEVKELEELIHRCNIRMSFIQNEATRMYKNRVVSLRETGDCKKNLHEKLGQLSTII